MFSKGRILKSPVLISFLRRPIMIIRETDPGMIYTRHVQELSPEEKDRVQEILEELRLIFNAESVGFEAPELTLYRKTNYTIRIFGGDTIGHIFD